MSTKEAPIVPVENIEHSIHLIRGQRVMLDQDLAALYGVETRALVQAAKRNIDRFPAGAGRAGAGGCTGHGGHRRTCSATHPPGSRRPRTRAAHRRRSFPTTVLNVVTIGARSLIVGDQFVDEERSAQGCASSRCGPRWPREGYRQPPIQPQARPMERRSMRTR